MVRKVIERRHNCYTASDGVDSHVSLSIYRYCLPTDLPIFLLSICLSTYLPTSTNHESVYLSIYDLSTRLIYLSIVLPHHPSDGSICLSNHPSTYRNAYFSLYLSKFIYLSTDLVSIWLSNRLKMLELSAHLSMFIYNCMYKYCIYIIYE